MVLAAVNDVGGGGGGGGGGEGGGIILVVERVRVMQIKSRLLLENIFYGFEKHKTFP